MVLGQFPRIRVAYNRLSQTAQRCRMKMFRQVSVVGYFMFLAVICWLGTACLAQSEYKPSAENLQARREFQDMKFGMFIHWGVYSVLGDGEWVFHDRHLKVDEYNRLPAFFDPEKFDPQAWVALAKSAGMKYITITSRHHDGFAMFD